MPDELSFEEWCKALAEEVRRLTDPRVLRLGADAQTCYLCLVLDEDPTYPAEEVRIRMEERELWPRCSWGPYAAYVDTLRDRIRTWAPMASCPLDSIPEWWEAFRCTSDNDSGQDGNLARAAWLEAGAPARWED